jgi:hypothetical protein
MAGPARWRSTGHPFAIPASTVVGDRAVTIDIFKDRELVPRPVRSGGLDDRFSLGPRLLELGLPSTVLAELLVWLNARGVESIGDASPEPLAPSQSARLVRGVRGVAPVRVSVASVRARCHRQQAPKEG